MTYHYKIIQNCYNLISAMIQRFLACSQIFNRASKIIPKIKKKNYIILEKFVRSDSGIFPGFKKNL